MNKITIPPSEAGYAFALSPEVAHIPLQGGLGCSIRDVIDSSTIVNVSWVVSVAGFEYLQKVYRYYVANEAEPFLIDLIIDSNAAVERIARIVPGSYNVNGIDGIRYSVSAQLEVLPLGFTEWPAYAGEDPDAGTCNCSIVAWLAGFETTNPTLEIGGGSANAHTVGEGSGAAPALYGDGNLYIGSDIKDGLLLLTPAVVIGNSWNLRFSMKVPALAFDTTGITLLEISDGFGPFARLKLYSMAPGTAAATFTIGTQYLPDALYLAPAPVAYDTVLNCELSLDGDYWRFFINGTLQVDWEGVTPRYGIQSIQWLEPGLSSNGIPFWLDEIRLQNAVEHVSSYTVDDIPFCRCEVTCNCANVAWQTNFELPDALMNIGYGTLSLNSEGDGVIADAALFGELGLRIGAVDADIMLFTYPAVPVAKSWTLRFSIKAPLNAFAAASIDLVSVYNSGGTENVRIGLQNNSGQMRFQYFYIPSFSSGTTSAMPYAARYDCEVNVEPGKFRFFVNGVRLVNQTISTPPSGISKLVWLNGSNPNAVPFDLDEIRVQNIIEHTDNYTVDDLPFCVCTHPVTYILDSFTGTANQNLEAHSGELLLNWTFIQGPTVIWYLGSCTAVTGLAGQTKLSSAGISMRLGTNVTTFPQKPFANFNGSLANYSGIVPEDNSSFFAEIEFSLPGDRGYKHSVMYAVDENNDDVFSFGFVEDTDIRIGFRAVDTASAVTDDTSVGWSASDDGFSWTTFKTVRMEVTNDRKTITMFANGRKIYTETMAASLQQIAQMGMLTPLSSELITRIMVGAL